jgi:peptidoglycan hydrolase-like protein with peptidoglycan-binding domain
VSEKKKGAKRTSFLGGDDGQAALTEDQAGNGPTGSQSSFDYATDESGRAVVFSMGKKDEGKASSDSEIGEIEGALASLGYYKGEPSGKYDEGLRDAVAAFKKDNDISGDGRTIDQATRDRILARASRDGGADSGAGLEDAEGGGL